MKHPIFLLLSALTISQFSGLGAEKAPRTEFTRMVAHWSKYSGPEYWDFLDDVNPELVQFGFHGGHFYSLSHTEKFGGYPAHFPMQGLAENSKWLKAQGKEFKKRKIVWIGHLNVEFLVGDLDGPDGPRGFFKWYRDMWDEKMLGPKPPVEDPVDFLEKDKDGNPMPKSSYNIGGMKEYFACLRNPHWQTVLKAWVSAGIDRGVDGFIANYFYRHDCHCEHCQKGFRDYLKSRHKPDELESKFDIADLEKHVFDEIVCWHKPEESTPLSREMLRWSQISNKQVFDEVFHKHGRKVKADLITAQWNHLSDFSAIKGDERTLLPADLWGTDESYTWYSMGASGVHTDIKNGVLADGALQARYIRGAFDDKPFVLGKYENVRTRVAIAELAANGGAPMGFYARIDSEPAREVFKTYYGFLERYRDLYHANRSYADLAIQFPRKEIHEGELAPLDAFKSMGKKLLSNHELFDVIPNDAADFEERSEKYRTVLHPHDSRLLTNLDHHDIQAPETVHVSATVPAKGGEIDLHFVNYNRKEFPPNPKNGRPNPGKGTQDENPIPVSGIQVAFFPPKGQEITSIEFISPESPEPKPLVSAVSEMRNNFTVPEFLVYGVVRMKTQPINQANAPKIAGVTTVYHHNSHADVLLSRMIQGKALDGDGPMPNMNLESVYVDQFPERDISRELEKNSNGEFKITKTIADALTLGTGKLAVDGVMLVGEHGDYPRSNTTQIVYPKRRLFTEILEVFDKSEKVVPVFSDKHLADNWEDAKWIYDEAKKRDIPLMAGSSLPGLWRYPPTDVPRDAKLKEIVAISYHTLDAYGFHAMEIVQCLAERRLGGETGIKRVQTIVGDDVWKSDLYDRKLFEQALDRHLNQKRLRRKPLSELVKEPVLFVMEYNDGLRASVLTLNGAAGEWSAAWELEDGTQDSALFWTQEARPFFHFSLLSDGIEKMMHTGKPTWPVERTLMTSGALDALLIAKRDAVKDWMNTPHLSKVKYKSHWDWKQPSPPPHSRPVHGQ